MKYYSRFYNSLVAPLGGVAKFQQSRTPLNVCAVFARIWCKVRKAMPSLSKYKAVSLLYINF